MVLRKVRSEKTLENSIKKVRAEKMAELTIWTKNKTKIYIVTNENKTLRSKLEKTLQERLRLPKNKCHRPNQLTVSPISIL